MGHSTVIALALFGLFFVYITARGELPSYLATIFGPLTTQAGSGSAVNTAASGIQSAAGAVSGAAGLVQGVQNLTNQVAALGGGSSGGFGGAGDFGTGGL